MSVVRQFAAAIIPCTCCIQVSKESKAMQGLEPARTDSSFYSLVIMAKGLYFIPPHCLDTGYEMELRLFLPRPNWCCHQTP